jgi:hypothetical protein
MSKFATLEDLRLMKRDELIMEIERYADAIAGRGGLETLMHMRSSLDAAALRTPEEADARPHAINLIDELLTVLEKLPAIK